VAMSRATFRNSSLPPSRIACPEFVDQIWTERAGKHNRNIRSRTRPQMTKPRQPRCPGFSTERVKLLFGVVTESTQQFVHVGQLMIDAAGELILISFCPPFSNEVPHGFRPVRFRPV